jgi:hypothetical protein
MLVGVIGTLVILAVWLSPTPEQIQAARNGQGKQGTQQSSPAGDAQPSLLGQYGEYEQSTFTPAPEQSAAAPAPEQSTSTPAPEQPRGWIAEVKKSRPICESADDYVQIQRMALRPSRKAMRRTVEFVKRKCPIKRFEPGNHASVERTETFSIDKTRSITLACVVIKDGPCAWTDASALVRIPEEAPAKKSTQSDTKSMQDDVDRPQQSDAAESDKVLAAVPFSVVQIARDSRACWPAYSENCITLTKGEEVVVPPGMQITLNPRRGLYCLRPLRIRRTTSVHSSSSGSNEACSFTDDTSEIDQHPSVTGCATAAAGLDDQLPPEHRH